MQRQTISKLLLLLIDSYQRREEVPSWEKWQHTVLTRSMWVTHKTKNEHPEFKRKLGQMQHTTRDTHTHFPQKLVHSLNPLKRVIPSDRESAGTTRFVIFNVVNNLVDVCVLNNSGLAVRKWCVSFTCRPVNFILCHEVKAFFMQY